MLPAAGDADGAAVGGLAHEVLLRVEEEGELHLPGVAVWLHEGVEVVAGVVEGACPAGGGGDVVAEVVGEERAGEGDGGGSEAGGEVPGAGEAQDVGLRCGKVAANGKKEGEEKLLHREGQMTNLKFQIFNVNIQSSIISGHNLHFLHRFAGGAVGFAGKVDGSVGLQGKDAEFQFGAAFGQTPEAEEEGTAVVEVVGDEAAVRVEAGAVAAVGDLQ